MEEIERLIARMTLEEKASLCSGLNFWHLKGIERLDIPSIIVTDGPHGLRMAREGETLSNAIPATCFPTASATACTWDRALLAEMGRAIGEECLQEGVAVILGPGMNIKRSPLCGRNFEYFSEDPFLAGEMAAALVEGIQSQGVGASVKHYAVNNQEQRRMTIDAIVDERTLREIYLAGYERVVKKTQPWTVMCAYNRLNGVYCSEDPWLLTEVLRDQWGFEGIVVTDWGACNDRALGLQAGQDLEMPGSGGVNDQKIVEAVRSGKLEMAVLDKAVARLLALIFKAVEHQKPGFQYDAEAHHRLARKIAADSCVLLKNEGAILPVDAAAKIALIGAFAKQPRYQGSGSSLMNPTRLDTMYDELTARGCDFEYAAGYAIQSDASDEALIGEACETARRAEVVILLAGLPPQDETEGLDREHMRMPDSHVQLIQRVAEANPNVVVVLSNGAPLEVPWFDAVKGLVEGYLGGQAGAGGAADVLFGDVNPGGKLAETFPFTNADGLSAAYFPGGPKTVEYREGIYVGYRYFDKARKAVRFPFGHGLSYTTFAYSDLDTSAERVDENGEVTVRVKITNTGQRGGAEVAQLYVRDVKSTAFRPVKELKEFAKVSLEPGEQKTVEFKLDRRAFAFFDAQAGDWVVESGLFEILVGASSADIRASLPLWVEAGERDFSALDFRARAGSYYDLRQLPDGIPAKEFAALHGKPLPPQGYVRGEQYDLNTPLGDFKHSIVGKMLYGQVAKGMNAMLGAEKDLTLKRMAEHMADDIPLRGLMTLGGGQVSGELIEAVLLLANRKFFRGITKLFQANRKKK